MTALTALGNCTCAGPFQGVKAGLGDWGSLENASQILVILSYLVCPVHELQLHRSMD